MCATESHSTFVWNIKYSAVLAAVIKSRGSIAGVWLTQWLTDSAAVACVCLCVCVCVCVSHTEVSLADPLCVAGVLRTMNPATILGFHTSKQSYICVCMSKMCALPPAAYVLCMRSTCCADNSQKIYFSRAAFVSHCQINTAKQNKQYCIDTNTSSLRCLWSAIYSQNGPIGAESCLILPYATENMPLWKEKKDKTQTSPNNIKIQYTTKAETIT